MMTMTAACQPMTSGERWKPLIMRTKPVEVPVSYGYFFKNGGNAAVNDTTTHYQGVQGEALLFLRANISIL